MSQESTPTPETTQDNPSQKPPNTFQAPTIDAVLKTSKEDLLRALSQIPNTTDQEESLEEIVSRIGFSGILSQQFQKLTESQKHKILAQLKEIAFEYLIPSTEVDTGIMIPPTSEELAEFQFLMILTGLEQQEMITTVHKLTQEMAEIIQTQK